MICYKVIDVDRESAIISYTNKDRKMVEIKEINELGHIRIEGYVNSRRIIVVSNERYWKVEESVCLPVDISQTVEIIDCMEKVINRVQNIIKNNS